MAEEVEMLADDVFRPFVGAEHAVLLHQLAEQVRMIDLRTGAAAILVEGRLGAHFPEGLGSKAFAQAFFVYRILGEMDEDARLHIAAGGDVGIAPAPGYAAVHSVPVVPEIEHQDGFGLARLKDAFPAFHPLAAGGYEFRIRIFADGNVLEDPAEGGAVGYLLVHEAVRAGGLVGLPGVG